MRLPVPRSLATRLFLRGIGSTTNMSCSGIPAARNPRGHGFGSQRTVSDRVRGVDFNQLFEDIPAEGLVGLCYNAGRDDPCRQGQRASVKSFFIVC